MDRFREGMGQKSPDQTKFPLTLQQSEPKTSSSRPDPKLIPNIEIDEEQIISSTGAASLKHAPKKTVIMRRTKFKLGTKVVSAKKNGNGKVDVVVEPAKGGKQEIVSIPSYSHHTIEWRKRIIPSAVGSRHRPCPLTQDLGLKEVGVEVDDRGRVVRDEELKTNIVWRDW
ncbi:hypothetical protein HK097_008303 [Rhizophlyctis rosea]|uniref:Uncharacterized protein n=1 Tax=Rhizophlyctis rosea TaxID=64517 RepID=A0AAD5SAI9_9FUNG|nr:hypothetical protein HK097_008303 [Rhizophlyctis rosea]